MDGSRSVHALVGLLAFANFCHIICNTLLFVKYQFSPFCRDAVCIGSVSFCGGRAQVSAGGVALSEIDRDSFESKAAPGAYLLGELLDVDGICGGYNLHFAWASAIISSHHLMESF